MVSPQYFVQDILKPVENEVFVDGGAYIGDTILSFISEFGKGKDYYKKIYAWEPDKNKRKYLIGVSKQHKNIEILPYGMWSKKDQLFFSAGQNGSSRIDGKGSESLEVNSIDNLCSDEKVTLIKMDIEGSEAEALHGARNVICRDKPRLAICIYHKPEDLFEIPFLVKEILPEYKLYIRHHSDYQNETVLYAVCDSVSVS